jgi:hypothetical protein
MKIRLAAAGLASVLGLAGLAGCSEDKCSVGDSCSKNCDPGQHGVCVAKGICACKAGDPPAGTDSGPGGGPGGMGGAGGGGGGDDCAAPAMGDLRINEVLIDGPTPETATEFIEMVNNADHPVALTGLHIKALKSGKLTDRVKFTRGCMPAKGAVAMYYDKNNWQWDPIPATASDYTTTSFSFSNSADFHFELDDVHGTVLDSFAGTADLIDPDISVNRSPDRTGDMLQKHTAVSPTMAKASPARCANGGRFVEDCVAPAPDGGPLTDGGPLGDGGRDAGPNPSDGGQHDAAPPVDAGPPPHVWIQEVYYDEPGSDAANVFIELAGDPGTPLDHVRLVAINGDSNTAYATIPLDGKAIGQSGVFVVAKGAMPGGYPADLVTSKADLQNGPDSLQLKFGPDPGTVLDALAYGTFMAGQEPAGEGTPAPPAPPTGNMGQSLSRNSDGADTNDNAADFHLGAPTPGVK